MKTKLLLRSVRFNVLFLFWLMLVSLSTYAQCPTIPDPSPPPICDASGLTINDLDIYATDTGDGIVWYNVATGGTALNTNQFLLEGVYYADNNSGNCGTRPSVTIDFEVNATGFTLDGIYCSNDNATVQTYINDVLIPNIPSGGSVQVFDDANLTTPSVGTNTLPIGPTAFFVVFLDSSNCESQIEIGSAAVFQSVDDPTPTPNQMFCSDTNPTIGNLEIGTTSTTFSWYSAIDGFGNPIPPALSSSDPLIDGNTYYIQVDDFFCDSNPVAVTVTIDTPVDSGISGTLQYCNDNLPAADFNLFDQLTGTPDTTGTWSGPIATSNGHLGTVNISGLTTANSYVFSYTVAANGACAGSSSLVTITVNETLSSGTPSAANSMFCEFERAANSPFDLFTLLQGADPGGQWTQGTLSTDPVVTSPIDISAFAVGTYDFTYTQNVTTPCSEVSTTVQLEILADPNAGNSNAIIPTFCENEVTLNSPFDLFTALDGSQDNNSGTWTDASNTTVTNPIDITAFTLAGSPYSFNYAIDNGRCVDITTIQIIIEDTPESGTPIVTFPEFCQGTSPANYNLFDLLDGEDQTGQWYIGTDTTGATTSNAIDTSTFPAGTYNYTYDVAAIGVCDDPLVTVQIIINPLPNTGVATPAIFCENATAGSSPLDLFSQLAGEDAGGTWVDTNSSGALTGSNVDLTALTIGSYNFTYSITDVNGCTNSSVVTVTINSAPESGTVNPPVEFCEGTSPVSYDLFDLLDGEDQTGQWYIGTDTTGVTTSNAIDTSTFPAGTYNYTYDVAAIGVCDDPLVTVQIIINPLPNTGVATPAIFCENATAGSSPLDLFGQLAGEDTGGIWADTNSSGALMGSNVDLTGLTIGSYNFTYSITDANGCTNSTVVTVTIDSAPESGTVNPPVEFCEGTSPVSYDLFDLLDGEDQTGQWYIGTDTTGATTSNAIDTSTFPAGTYNYTYDVAAIGVCDDPLVTVQIIINPLPNTGVATPAIFCENVTAGSSPLDLFGQLAGEDAGGTWADTNSSGALTGSNVDLTALAIGSYNFTYSITDANGCTNSSIVAVTIDDAPESGTANPPVEFCIVNVASAETYDLFNLLENEDQTGVWNDDDTSGALSGNLVTIDGLAAGTYNFTYNVDAIGTCDDVDVTVSVIINDIAAPSATAIQEFCDAATIADLTATGTVIQWYDVANGGLPLSGTTDLVNGQSYYATQTDANTSCESSLRTSVIATIYNSPNAGAPNATPITSCNTETNIDLFTGLDGTQDMGGVWQNTDGVGVLTGNSFDATGVSAGAYQFTYLVTGTSPCVDDSAVITVTLEAPFNPGTSNGDVALCNTDADFDLFSNLSGADAGGEWMFNGNTITNIIEPSTADSGLYTYTFTNICGTASVSFNLDITPAPNAGENGDFVICLAEVNASNTILDLFTVLGGTPDTVGVFTTSDISGFTGNTVDLLTLTIGTTYNFTYTVLATVPCAIDTSSEVTVTINDSPAATVINLNPEFCLVDNPTVADLSNSLTIAGTVNWYADAALTLPLNTSDVLEDGEDYFATQTSNAGCESSVSITLNVTVNDTDTPTLEDASINYCISDAPTIADLTSNILEYDTDLDNVRWYDSETAGNLISSDTNLTLDTSYYAALFDAVIGCESSVRLEVIPDLRGGCGLVELPDGFSPNGDGVNDTYDVDFLADIYPDFEIEIFNRNGNIVYKGKASTPRFDGTSNQSRVIVKGDLPVGVYFYIFYFNNGTDKPEQGRLYLSR